MSLFPFGAILKVKALIDWRRRGYSDHAPQFVKEALFARYAIPGATWIETGTFMGKTTQVLAGLSPRVYSIEPAPRLYERATRKFAGSHVTVLNGVSEEVFPELLPTLSGDVCFWLDGHFSGGSTFQGATACPIEQELDTITACLPQFGKLTILIDDVRLFVHNTGAFADYPSLDYLVDWARARGFEWRIEHDIFIIRNWS